MEDFIKYSGFLLSAVRNNGFGNRFSNLSAKNKFANHSNPYMEEVRMNHYGRNQIASSASSFMNMNSIHKSFNRSNLELNSAEKN
jgi:hypothetical protein